MRNSNLYASLNVIRVIKLRRMRCVGLVAHMVEMKYSYKIFIGKPEWKKPSRKPKCRWEE
jgi:hypothetical protein